jgi:hypothetical protein
VLEILSNPVDEPVPVVRNADGSIQVRLLWSMRRTAVRLDADGVEGIHKGKL